jgi:glycosyltransferase involved in cell wall biosynthesis
VTEIPQISVVIPTFNREKIVTRAIESVLVQTTRPAEILVVDDGSTDGTRTVVESIGPKVRYIRQANRGVASARNLGAREAISPWIAFLDSDDVWTPDHLRRMTTAIQLTGGGAPLYFADVQLTESNRNLSLWGLAGFGIMGDWHLEQDPGDWVLLNVQPMLLQASVVSKEAYWAVGGLPEELRTREDTLLFLKLGLMFPACAVAGCGTIMNSQDDIRLTKVYDEASTTYCEASVSLYRDLLETVKPLSAVRRKILTESLVGAHFAAARVLKRKRRYRSSMHHLITAFIVHPGFSTRELTRSVGRNVKNVVGTKLAPASLGPAENKDGSGI